MRLSRAHVRIRLALFSGALGAWVSACQGAKETVAADAPGRATDTTLQGIRNGERAPRRTPLSSGQIAAIGYLYDVGAPESAFCTGTLIAPRLVVTARHCTEGVLAAELGFGVGEVPTTPLANFAVESIYEHPERDVSLLALTRAVAADVPGIVPIAINRVALDASHTGHQVEAAGFGETLDPMKTGRYFALVMLAAVDDLYVLVDGQQLEGLCFGDSGGPVLDLGVDGRPVILGVEHGGEESCVGRDQLARLDRVQGWIDQVAATLPSGEICGMESYTGRCDGNTAVWCHEDGQIAHLDCTREGRVCAFVDEETGFYCKAAEDCGGEATGCQNGLRIFCHQGLLYQEDCPARGAQCTEDAGGPICIGPDGRPLEALPVPGAEPEPEPLPDDLVSGEALPGETPDPGGPAPATVPETAETPEAVEEKSGRYRGACQATPVGSAGSAPLAVLMGLIGLLGLGLRRPRRSPA